MKVFLVKVWGGVKVVWGWLVAAWHFIHDFVAWIKTRKSDGGAQ